MNLDIGLLIGGLPDGNAGFVLSLRDLNGSISVAELQMYVAGSSAV